MRLVTLILVVVTSLAHAEVPQPAFYLPLDGSTRAVVAAGSPSAAFSTESDVLFTLLNMERKAFVPGRVGSAYEVGNSPLVYRCAGNFRPDEGTCSFWVSPQFRGDDRNLYCTFWGAADWGMVYKYENQTSLTFATARPDKDLFYDCGAPDIRSWEPGQWHHIVLTWSRRANQRRIFVDGRLQGQGPFPFAREVKDGPMFVGAGCTLYPKPVAHAIMDEVALWDQPLTVAQVAEVYALGQTGTPLMNLRAETIPRSGELNVVIPQTPPMPPQAPAARYKTPTREDLSLDGLWAILPAMEPLSQLPAAGWGFTAIPGYWTDRGKTTGPDGKPVTGSWTGKTLDSFPLAYLQTTFTADPAWRGRPVFLNLDGVDGLAEVYLNGTRLGWVDTWEDEAFAIADRVRWDGPNTVTVVLYRRQGSPRAGLYGSVSVQVRNGSFIRDTAIRPSVATGMLELDCAVWAAAERTVTMEAEVAPVDGGEPTRHLRQTVTLPAAELTHPDQYSQCQRVTVRFPWPDAHPWCIEDPFLYRLTVRLTSGDETVDEMPPQEFGFREVTQRDGDLLLNGKPLHLRGHQIDFGWGDQMPRVLELKDAGMNCMELSGPIRNDWYAGTPYQQQAFEETLRYADRRGLIAVPVLPDAAVIRERIFEPRVAELYARRVDKHIRRWGNHPSLGMWFMHFNLAFYYWAMAPDKVGAGYKPTDAAFAAKERFMLEAQRIARQYDGRPIYHHSCGAVGDIFTINCYIGPNAPLQEREEWPSAWAQNHSFPLVACEHCCFLIPYWFRPRQFPLSVVYAGEPIFDEICAMFQGNRAYEELTPEVFDRYDIGVTPRGDRVRTLIRMHRGYQQVKSQVARQSLRAWRTWGVSGIIFNAINWDFKDAEGQPLPVMRALARYFGDTDLYVAGQPGDWPSKDHVYFPGETIRKQVVLLNDRSRDVPVSLRAQLLDEAGRELAVLSANTVAQAGTPTFCPVELTAPDATAARHLSLRVSAEPADLFQPDSFALSVLPRQVPPTVKGRVLLWDPVGDTRAMLSHMGVRAEPLTAASNPREADLVVVGRKAWNDEFMKLVDQIGLEAAITNGLNLLAFEQIAGAPCGAPLEEQSWRQAFIAQPGHPFLEGLTEEELRDLRGQSDLVQAYPPAPADTVRRWPPRFYKWSNRGVLSTFVAHKPQLSPLLPVLDCGFDLAQSPLLEGRFGAGRVVLCQMDVTSRYGTDPVSTRLMGNLLKSLSARGTAAPVRAAACDAKAAAFVEPFGVTAPVSAAPDADLFFLGPAPLSDSAAAAVERAVRAGATAVLLPGSPAAERFGLRLNKERAFRVSWGKDPLLTGLNAGDGYLKARLEVPAAAAEGGWQPLAEPGVVAVRALGPGRLIVCTLDPSVLQGRARIKALRLWNALLANLHAPREGLSDFLRPSHPVWEANEPEQLPPYMDW